MALSTLNVAFIGAGVVNFGHPECPWDHATRLEQLGNIRVVAIVDVDTNKAKLVLKSRQQGKQPQLYDTCKVYGSIDDLLISNNKPDVAFIGIPPGYRGSLRNDKDVELKFVKAGIHAFIEKPISLAPLDSFYEYVKAMADAEQSTKTVVSVGYMFRYHAAIEKMKDLIAAHGGKVMALNARYSASYPSLRNPYWWDREISGGTIVEQATHFCDLARYLAGDIDLNSIQTTTLRHNDAGGAGVLTKLPEDCDVSVPNERKVASVTATQWRFLGGGLGSLFHTVCVHGKKYEATIDVFMDGLRLSLEEPYLDTCHLRVRGENSDDDVIFEFGDCDPYIKEISTFMNAVRTGNKSEIKSPYQDASKTYEFTRKIVAAEKR